jgi:hypothetical protein
MFNNRRLGGGVTHRPFVLFCIVVAYVATVSVGLLIAIATSAGPLGPIPMPAPGLP